MTELLPDPEQLTGLLAAWMLLLAAALVAARERLRLTRRMLLASGRGLVQLLLLAWLLHYLFDIKHPLAQGGVILCLCLIAATISAGHYPRSRPAWAAASIGLAAAAAVTLPWLVATGAIGGETRSLIPLGSMVVANAMNAVSLTYDRFAADHDLGESVRAALIPPIDTLRVVGLVHMPGIFVGMLLAGSPPLAAAGAQLVVLYMIVASSFTACIVSWYMLRFLERGVRACG